MQEFKLFIGSIEAERFGQNRQKMQNRRWGVDGNRPDLLMTFSVPFGSGAGHGGRHGPTPTALHSIRLEVDQRHTGAYAVKRAQEATEPIRVARPTQALRELSRSS